MQNWNWRRIKYIFQLPDKSIIEKTHEKIYKPDPVFRNKSERLLFIYALHYCKTLADYPSDFKTSRLYSGKNPEEPIYLPLLRAEFTWFHYSRTVHTFCCTGHHLTMQGRYPIRCSMESGLSFPK